MEEKRQYKAGDVVRLTRERGNGWDSSGKMDHYCGKVVTLTDVDAGYIHFADQGSWVFRTTDVIELIKAAEDVDEGSDLGYIALKSLSCASIHTGQPCADEFSNYVREMTEASYGFYDNPKLGFVLECCKKYAWKPWLLVHGYIKQVDTVQYKPVSVGDQFKVNGYDAMLVMLDYGRLRLVHCNAAADMWANLKTVEVGNPRRITLDEFKQLVSTGCNDTWQEVYKTRKPWQKTTT